MDKQFKTLVFLLSLSAVMWAEKPLTNLFDDDKLVLSLDFKHFDKEVFGSKKVHLVLFYLSWCGHCIKYAPTYMEIASQLSVWRDDLSVSAVNCAVEDNMNLVCKNYNVTGFPTVGLFPPGSKPSSYQVIDSAIVHSKEQLVKHMEIKLLHHIPSAHRRPDVIPVNNTNPLIVKANKEKLSTDEVFYEDLIFAIRYSLTMEIGSHAVLSEDRMETLKVFLDTLINWFPAKDEEVRKSLHKTMKNIQELSTLTSSEWAEIIKTSGFLSSTDPYKDKLVRCAGSNPIYRGYPCTLWTLFHTITAQAHVYGQPGFSYKVLTTVQMYVEKFFGCRECAENFGKMATEIKNLNKESNQDAVIWLWNAHNRANKRLAGDKSEDPEHKKIQFPSIKACPVCRTPKGIYDESKVFEFLLNLYTDIKMISPEPTRRSKRLFSGHIPELWAPKGMNLVDFSMSYLFFLAPVIIIGFMFYIVRKRNFLKLRIRKVASY